MSARLCERSGGMRSNALRTLYNSNLSLIEDWGKILLTLETATHPYIYRTGRPKLFVEPQSISKSWNSTSIVTGGSDGVPAPKAHHMRLYVTYPHLYFHIVHPPQFGKHLHFALHSVTCHLSSETVATQCIAPLIKSSNRNMNPT